MLRICMVLGSEVERIWTTLLCARLFSLSWRIPGQYFKLGRPGSVVYSNWLQTGRSGGRIAAGTRFSAPVQTGPGAHPTSCTMRTGSFPGVKSGRGVTLTPHSLLMPWSRKSRAIPLFPLWVVRPVHSLSACTKVHFTFHLTSN